MASDKDMASGGDDANGHADAATALNTSQAVLQYFWDMASYDENVRVAAANGLVKDVMEDQTKHLATLAKDMEKAPEEGAPKIKLLEYHLRRCSPTMVYTLRRLARGLSSSRQAARQGYAAALTGLLAAAASPSASAPSSGGGSRFLTSAGVLVLLEVCVDGPLRGGDAKDTLLGRVFGFGALLRSGLPLEPPVLSALLNGLLECGHRKSFLRECAAAVALEAAVRVDAATLADLTAPGQPLANALAAAPSEATPETLLLALVLWPKLPASVLATCRLLPADTPAPPPELFAVGGSGSSPAAGALSAEAAAAAARTAAGFFTREHLRSVLPALLATSVAHPRLHTLWQYLLPLLLPGFRPQPRSGAAADKADGAVDGQPQVEEEAAAAAPPPPGGKKAAKAAAKAAKASAAAARSAEGKGAVSGPLLGAFWGVVVEGGLMDSSQERRYLGFQLFSRVLPHLRPDTVGTVFSPIFVRVLAGAVKLKSNYLHASGKKLMEGLSAFLDRSSSADVATKMAVAAAVSKLGGLATKNMTAHALVNKVVQGMDSSSLHRHLASLKESFLRGLPPLRPGQVEAGAGQQQEEEDGGRDREQMVSERRAQCAEQLVSALRFPAASEADAQAAVHFLALHAFAQVAPKAAKKASKGASKQQSALHPLPEVAQAAEMLTTPLSPATRTACASRLLALIANLGAAAQARIRDSARKRQADGADAAAAPSAAEQPSAKKRKTAGGGAVAADAGAAVPTPPPAGTIHQALHNALSYIRKALASPGVSPAAELGEAAESGLSLLAAVETASLERIHQLEKESAQAGQAAATPGGKGQAGGGKAAKKGAKVQTPHLGGGAGSPQGDASGGGGAAASRLRALAALAAQLQLALLSDPAGFEMDLPLSLRRVAAEGLGLEGLPEVEEEEEESGSEEGEGEDDMREDPNVGKKAKEGSQSGGGASGPGPWSDVLVDLLLALMARPAGSVPIAPLRDAAEAVWRQCCEGVSAEGLADIVRVVAAGGKGEGQDAAGLYESDDDEEEEVEEEGDESEEEEEEEEGKAANGKLSGKRKKAEDDDSGSDEDDGSGSGSEKDGSEGEDDDDEEEEGMDDEAMFRMDSKLAAYFKSMVGGRAGGKAAAERATALLDFRLRALRLLEGLAKKNPNSPLLIGALVPLVRALATASRPGGQPQMASRLASFLRGMCRGRWSVDLAAIGGAEGYSMALKRLLYEASRNKDKEVAAVAWMAFTGAVKAGAVPEGEQPEAAEASRSAFRAALSDFLTKKKTRLQSKDMVTAFRAAPRAALPSLDLLLHHVAAGRNPAVRAAAAEMTAELFKAPPAGMSDVWSAAGAGGDGGGAAAAAALGGALGGALAACAAGVGLKVKLHNRVALSAVSMARVLMKRFLGGRRPAELLGPDKINAIAKAVVTVKSTGVAPKVAQKLDELSEVLGLGPLLAKTKPDPALAAKILKAAPAAPAPASAGKAAKAADASNGKEGGKKGGQGKAPAQPKVGEGKDKGKGEAKGKRKEEESREEDSEKEEEEEGSDSEEEGDDDASGSGSEDEEEEEEPSGSGRGDSDDEVEEDQEGGSSDEEAKDEGGAGGPKRDGARGGRHGGGRGRGGQGGRGGRGRGRGGRGRGPGRGGQQQGQGGPSAKKARH